MIRISKIKFFRLYGTIKRDFAERFRTKHQIETGQDVYLRTQNLRFENLRLHATCVQNHANENRLHSAINIICNCD